MKLSVCQVFFILVFGLKIVELSKGFADFRVSIGIQSGAGILRTRCKLYKGFGHDSLYIEYLNTIITQR